MIVSRPNQFPSKFGTLPQISARNSPDVNSHNQLVPANRQSIDGLEAEERVRVLESRVNVTEKSNRALLEEVVRLQSELKGNKTMDCHKNNQVVISLFIILFRIPFRLLHLSWSKRLGHSPTLLPFSFIILWFQTNAQI